MEPGRARLPHTTGPRVGVSGDGADPDRYPWRLWLPGEPTVSVFRPAGPPRRRAERGRVDRLTRTVGPLVARTRHTVGRTASRTREDAPVTDIFDELQWRGLVAQTTDEAALRSALAAGPVSLYCGFDPSAPSLHIGNLVQILTVRRLQLAGHRPFALVGGATGLIGDPKMVGERTLNAPDVVAGWVERIRRQIEPLLDFDGPAAAQMVNNLDWTAPMSAIDFLRDVGKHYRLGTMLAKDTVARRLNSDQGISFTEFSYQILQGMDYLELHRRHGISLQTGGSDQWGNLLSGVELIRKVEGTAVHAAHDTAHHQGGRDEVRQDGVRDRLAGRRDDEPVRLLPVLAQRRRRRRRALPQGLHLPDPGARSTRSGPRSRSVPAAREAQRALAHDVTSLVHGTAATDGVVAASQALFGRGDLRALDAAHDRRGGRRAAEHDRPAG